MAADPPGAERVRLDKWLWAARFFKTRALAASEIEAGHVRVAGERAKPAKPIKVGDRVTVWRSGLSWEVDVLALAERRGSAPEAARLYAETEASAQTRADEIARRRAAAAEAGARGRPTKRDRRRLEDFLDEP